MQLTAKCTSKEAAVMSQYTIEYRVVWLKMHAKGITCTSLFFARDRTNRLSHYNQNVNGASVSCCDE